MYLQNPKIKYKNEAGSWTELSNLIACDPGFVNRPGRPTKGAEGLYTTKFLDDVRAIYTGGVVTSIDNLITGDKIELQIWDGSKWIQATFNVSSNQNDSIEPSKRILIISAIPEIYQTIITEGGSGSEVTKSYVDAGDAATLSSAKSYTDTQTADMMTTDTEQSITGKKNFTSGNLTVDSNAVLTSSDAYTKDQSNAAYVAKSTATSGVTAYVRDSGSESNMSVAQVATANSIARRAGNGVLFVGEPTADSHAATKKYVDDNKGTVVSGTNDGTNWTDITIAGTKMNIPSGGSGPTNYLKSITKDETNKKITIKDQSDTTTEFEYGGSGTTYTAGNGLSLSGTEFSINTSITATKAEVDKKIDGNSQISKLGIDADGDIYVVED